jgi:hypothetical protein
MIVTTRVKNEGLPVSQYINKPVKNSFNESIGIITKAEEIGDYVELTMYIRPPESLIKPMARSFSIDRGGIL